MSNSRYHRCCIAVFVFFPAADRGQNSPCVYPNNPGELITESIDRADVWVFDANSAGRHTVNYRDTVW